MDCDVTSLKRGRIPIVKVRWNSKRGLEFTWEREEYMESKYPQLFVDRVDDQTSVVKLLLDYFGKLSISDQLEWVLWYAPWLSDQLEWICGMLHGLVINWSSFAIETSHNRVNGLTTVDVVQSDGLRKGFLSRVGSDEQILDEPHLDSSSI
ncbi:hypothetical protein Tco_0567455 [Tanacetum coccineum]